MSRKEEFEKVKQIIKEKYEDADCGIFFSRNWVGDPMENIFTGKIFSVDICYSWKYFEVFGCSEEEEEELIEFYNNLEE